MANILQKGGKKKLRPRPNVHLKIQQKPQQCSSIYTFINNNISKFLKLISKLNNKKTNIYIAIISYIIRYNHDHVYQAVVKIGVIIIDLNYKYNWIAFSIFFLSRLLIIINLSHFTINIIIIA